MYELQTFYHRRALLSTRILCQREKLPRNCKTFGKECEFCVKGAAAELHVLQGHSEVLPVYSAKEKQPSEQLPSPRDVLEARGVGLHRREIVANVVSRTDLPNTVRDEDAVVQNNLSLDRRKVSSFHPQKPAQERENAEAVAERRKVHDGEKHTQKG